MSVSALAVLLVSQAASPGNGTLWLDGEAYAVEVTLCDRDTDTAGARGTHADGGEVSVMLQRWPGMHALSVVYDNTQWVHRGPEDSGDAPHIASWTESGQLSASGTVSIFPPIREASMDVRFEGRCPG